MARLNLLAEEHHDTPDASAYSSSPDDDYTEPRRKATSATDAQEIEAESHSVDDDAAGEPIEHEIASAKVKNSKKGYRNLSKSANLGRPMTPKERTKRYRERKKVKNSAVVDEPAKSTSPDRVESRSPQAPKRPRGRPRIHPIGYVRKRRPKLPQAFADENTTIEDIADNHTSNVYLEDENNAAASAVTEPDTTIPVATQAELDKMIAECAILSNILAVVTRTSNTQTNPFIHPGAPLPQSFVVDMTPLFPGTEVKEVQNDNVTADAVNSDVVRVNQATKPRITTNPSENANGFNNFYGQPGYKSPASLKLRSTMESDSEDENSVLDEDPFA